MSFRSVFIGFFGVVFFFVTALSLHITLTSSVLAQDATPTPTPNPSGTPLPGTAENPWEIGYTKAEFQAYQNAIEETNCTTPSLECLVRNTTRFVAIEWVQEIMGSNFTVWDADGNRVGAEIPTSQRVAQGGQGIINTTFNLIGSMYSYRPASTSRYVAYVIDNADLAPPAYAQGIGFAALDPILDLWRMFRNVAYFFFIGVFIVIGFLIMFRQNFSGKSAITAQQAIPSIIISLILVTFSYAISGFLIDIMYLVMFAMLYIFGIALGQDNVATDAVTWNIFELAGNLIGGASVSGFTSNVDFVGNIIDGVFSLGDGGNALSGAFAWAGGLTMSIILAVAILIGMIKLFFELLKSYASILMGVIFAPIYLMLGAIPGNNSFGPWIKNLIGNLAAFPTVLLFVMMYKVFTSDLIGLEGAAGFMPPYLIGSGQGGIAAHLLGLAVILALPEIVKKVKETMGAKEGGFGWMVANAAANQAKQGMPIGMGVTGAGLIGAGGLIGGTLRGVTSADFRTKWNTGLRGQAIRQALSTGGKYAGNYLDYGRRAGGWAATQLGGSTPGYLKPVESAITNLSGNWTQKKQLERRARADYEEKTLLQKLRDPGVMSDAETKAAIAQADYEKERKEALYAEASKGKGADQSKMAQLQQAKIRP